MIVVCEFLSSTALKHLEQSGLEVIYAPNLYKDRAALKTRLVSATALIVRNYTQVDADLIVGAPNLKVVGRLGVGLDNINQADLKARGVELYFARGINANSVAEYVLAALLVLARNLVVASEHVRGGGWNRTSFGGFELKGKTLGLIGFGEVARRVAKRARAFGMKVLVGDPHRLAWETAIDDSEVSLVPIAEVLRQAQFVSLHAPLVPETRQLIRAETLELMPKGAYLINTARGELINNADLAQALRSGHLGGAVLDVVDPEPLPEQHVLRGIANLWITPHIGGISYEAQENVGLRVAEGVLAALGVAKAE